MNLSTTEINVLWYGVPTFKKQLLHKRKIFFNSLIMVLFWQRKQNWFLQSNLKNYLLCEGFSHLAINLNFQPLLAFTIIQHLEFFSLWIIPHFEDLRNGRGKQNWAVKNDSASFLSNKNETQNNMEICVR